MYYIKVNMNIHTWMDKCMICNLHIHHNDHSEKLDVGIFLSASQVGELLTTWILLSEGYLDLDPLGSFVVIVAVPWKLQALTWLECFW